MAKQAQTAFDVNVLFGAAIQASGTGADKAAMVKAAAPALKGRSLLDCVESFLRGEALEGAVAAGKQAAVNRASELLAKQGVDMFDIDAVRGALLPVFWTHDGQEGAPTKAAAGDAPSDEDKATAKTVYNRIYAQARRMALAILGEDAPETVVISVPRAVQAEINAMEKRIAELKEQHTAAVVNEAKRLFAEALKNKKAKSKAAK